MKRVLIVLGIIVALLLIVIAVVPFLIPSSVYKAQIEKAAANATGREVTLTGDPSLSIFPRISVKIDGATISNPEGFSAENMIEAGAFRASLKLWPLFSQRVEVGEITLSDATVSLERLESGEANWIFESVEGTEEAPEETQGGSGGFQTTIARARLQNAAVFYKDRETGADYALTEVNMEAKLTALDEPLLSKGSGRLNGQAFAYEIDLDTVDDLTNQRPASLVASLETDYGSVSYDGAITLGDVVELDGGFEAGSQTLGTIIALVGADLPIRPEALKGFEAKGRISGPTDALQIDLSKTELRAEGVEIDYTGKLSLSAEPMLDGQVEVKADTPSQLFKPGQGIAGLTIVEDLDFSASVSGPVSGLQLSNVVMTHSGDLLDAGFRGALGLSGAGSLNGQISASSEDLRGLLGAMAVEMPEGETLRSFSLGGNASGTFAALSLADMELQLDDLTAAGKLGADMRGSRPRVTADLTMPSLNLTPFLGTSETDPNTAQAQTTGWDDTPLALDGLKAVDADLTLNAGSVTLNTITLEDALLSVGLTNGRLQALFRRADDQPGFRAFDGGWAGDMVLDASRAEPSLSFKAGANGIAARKMLDALIGFDGLGGVGEVNLDLTSSGKSLKALVEGLDGTFDTTLNDGALRGINLAQMVRSADNLQGLLTNGELSLASFQDAISPEAETDFTEMLSGLRFENGVATIQELRLDNPVVGVSGSGTIDLGAQTIDVRLVPRVDQSAQGGGQTIGVSGIPIPVRISGSWTDLSYSLDSAAVQQELVARARGQVADEIASQIEGPLGGLIGEVVGGGRQTQPAQQPSEPSESTQTEEEPNVEDQVRDRVLDEAFGAIFGGEKKEEGGE